MGGEDGGGEDVDLRFTRTFRTAEMLATRAFGRFADEGGRALMASSTDSMDRGLPHDFIAGGDLWHHEQLRFRPRTWIRRRIDSNRGHRLRRCGLGLGLGLGLLQRLVRETRTFLAAGMRAIAADFLGPESDLAAMTLSMNAHPHCLLHSSRIAFPDRCPLAGFERQAPLCEESTGFFFLELGVGGGGGDGGGGDGELGGLSGGFLQLWHCGLGGLGTGRTRWG